MKKSLILLALVGLFIGGTSCRSKKEEPKNPTPTPVNPVEPTTDPNKAEPSADLSKIKNAQAVFTLPAGSVVHISPKKGLTILGATMDASDSTKFTVGTDGLFGINGNTEALSIKSDNITNISLTKPSPLLKRLRLYTESQSASAPKTTIDLSGVTELEALLVAGYTVDVLDLSKATKLKVLALGAFNWGKHFPEVNKVLGSYPEKSTDIKEVKLPANNVIEYIAGRAPIQDGKFDTNNLPKLKKFFWQSPYFKDFSFAKSQDLELLAANRPTGSIKINADLGNKPKLQDITFQDVNLSKLSVSNTTAANLLKDTNSSAEVVEFDNIDPAQAVSYIKRTAVKIEKEGSSTVRVPVTKSITLKNMSLTEAQVLDLITGLGTTNGTLKVKADLLTTDVKAALTTKHWMGSPL
jgi:lipoprotein